MIIRRVWSDDTQFISVDDLKVRIESNVFQCNDALLNDGISREEILSIAAAREAWQIILDELYWVEEQPKRVTGAPTNG